jgi:2-polyprenyl-3-methyl-5-hydroxy-6-metoxy-1,4-benzoquinol methylase
MVERLSLTDNSLLSGYAENIQRTEFALAHCQGKRVLDAGCGSGYASHFLAANGAASVLGLDNSDEAIAEARRIYPRGNLRFEQRDLQCLDADAMRARFEVVVNFETLPHLPDPRAFIAGVKAALADGGTFITSTPNGERVRTDPAGRPLYKFQHKAYPPAEFGAFLHEHFIDVALYGHWMTHAGMLRKLRARELFEQLCDLYYNPMNRCGRAIKKVFNRKTAAPPVFTGEADSYAGDYVIAPLNAGGFPWLPTTLIAVCKI